MDLEKQIFHFSELSKLEGNLQWDEIVGVLGGKGANLAKMTSLGLPVPPGFTITTNTCREFLAGNGKLSDHLKKEIKEALSHLEEETGKRLGGSPPLLVSCRSGAKFSMPGMMDTILNLGLNDDVAENFSKETGNRRFVYDSYRRLLQMFGSVVMGIDSEAFENKLAEAKEKRNVKSDTELGADDLYSLTEEFKRIISEHGHLFPQDPYEQIERAIESVFLSWNSKRAIDYREATGIPHHLGTAVNIVTMVFGNTGDNSGTGVAFTRDPATGQRVIFGEYMPNAQGEDVVAGIRTSESLDLLKKDMPEIYRELCESCQKLERYYKDMQDIEFTVEDGKLWILQTRSAKRTAKAAIKVATDMVKEGLKEREDALASVDPEAVKTLLHPYFKHEEKKAALSNGMLAATGLNTSPGAAVGIACFSSAQAQRLAAKSPVVLINKNLQPDDIHGMLASVGLITSEGGATSHAAVVARQFGIPCVSAVPDLEISPDKDSCILGGRHIKEGDWLSVDGSSGEIFIGKLPTEKPTIEEQEDLLTILR
ncbi:MAG: pyruvate, phosphate dikinase, partial [Candidatus Dadabacteria bacterium]